MHIMYNFKFMGARKTLSLSVACDAVKKRGQKVTNQRIQNGGISGE
jgi:hypothetical protein